MDWKSLFHNHWAHMALCLVPLLVLVAGVYGFGWSRSYLIWGFVILCPLMHLFMMKDMHGQKAKAVEGGNDGGKSGGCH